MALAQKQFSDLITFQRASAGWYFNSSGVLVQAAVDAPRFNYDPVTLLPRGMLIEGARTNLLLRSAEFDNAAWTKVNGFLVTPNAIAAPDGTLTADKLIAPAGVGVDRYVAQTVTLSAASAFSVFLKKGELNFVRIGCLGRSATGEESKTNIDLTTLAQNNSVGASPLVVTPINNGWIRVSLPRDVIAGSTQVEVRIGLVDSLVDSNITGDGVSGVYAWCAQLEPGAFATSPIPTTTTQVTRAADVAAVNVLSPWFNSAEGTLFAEYTQVAGADDPGYAVAFSPVSAGAYAAINGAAGVQTGWYVFGLKSTRLTTGLPHKQALAYTSASNAFASVGDGGTVFKSSSSDYTGLSNKLSIGSARSRPINGHIRAIRYYPLRLTDAELQALTA